MHLVEEVGEEKEKQKGGKGGEPEGGAGGGVLMCVNDASVLTLLTQAYAANTSKLC